MVSFLKKNIIIPCGLKAAYIPYRYVPFIGGIYSREAGTIDLYESLDVQGKREFIFSKMYDLVKYAVENIPFYRDYYAKCGFSVSDLKTFDDISSIPPVNKKMLMECPLEYRSANVAGRYTANTGGSSGHPLTFYRTKDSRIREMAYMHRIWAKLGYRKSDLKVQFTGRSTMVEPLRYDLPRNTLMADVYRPFEQIVEALDGFSGKIRYLHGYPSAIYEFALYCRENGIEGRAMFDGLKGAFLSSEYPYGHFRDIIESVFGIDTVSWYGHTEVCVLAYEGHEKYVYNPFQSYGYAEACMDGSNGKYRLIGTSYYNMASPLIRYDTEDTVDYPVYEDGILSSFAIKDGRSGQFIVDADGKNITLTGLIFGRHHALFDYCSHIQLCQKGKGEALVLYTASGALPDDFRAAEFFDSSNVNIKFSFRRLQNPVKTPSGKVNLLVRAEELPKEKKHI